MKTATKNIMLFLITMMVFFLLISMGQIYFRDDYGELLFTTGYGIGVLVYYIMKREK